MKLDTPSELDRERRALPTTEGGAVRIKDVHIGARTRFIVWLFRKFLRPVLGWMLNGGDGRIARVQLWLASRVCVDTSGLPLEYVVLGRVPGHLLGSIADTSRRVVLYLHGGAFVLPAVPETHVTFVSRLCRDLDAIGFLPDYRLGPFNKYPAALDDCERAYEALLQLGFDPRKIVVAGESAGGNLLLGMLQRIRRRGWPMPSCAIPISPATEMGRMHAPPSRATRYRKDPLLPMVALHKVDEMYARGADASDPELSPLYADLRGFPPLYLLVSDNEILLDDTVLFARRAQGAGLDVQFEVWPIVPHAFPLFARFMPEVRQARTDIVAFAKRYLA
ncbi:MAG TPA: alpha/beta hydrolase fold domain-containing protein [Candidatus Binatia bacterium]|nr:alpha/beta hydrolase fold domain-containing protein [Candidatus Binatia bacterium]